MLRVASLTAGRGPYYLDDRADELAVLLGPSAVPSPSWWGDAAAPLGLEGPVDATSLGAVLDGRRPGGPRPLRARAGSVAAYDLTFAAPKSVSVLCALGGPSVAAAVVGSHEDSVTAALGYVQARAVAVRRRLQGASVSLPTDGMVAARFTHGASRVGDPHLHTHVVVANLGHGADGRWTALDGRGLHAHAPAGGALYRAHLRHRLAAELGVEWRGRVRREMAGLDPVLLGDFSGRRADIRRVAAERSVRSARGQRVVAAATREPKATAGRRAALPRWWCARAAELGVVPEELALVTGRRVAPDTGIDEWRFASMLHEGDDRPLTRRRVVEAWSESVTQGVPAAEVEGSVTRWVAERGVGVDERVLAPRDVEVPGYLVTALGPRPPTAAAQAVWQEAARSIAAYRARWSVQGPGPALGVDDRAALSALPVRRLAEHLRADQMIDDARARLGRRRARAFTVPEHELAR